MYHSFSFSYLTMGVDCSFSWVVYFSRRLSVSPRSMVPLTELGSTEVLLIYSSWYLSSTVINESTVLYLLTRLAFLFFTESLFCFTYTAVTDNTINVANAMIMIHMISSLNSSSSSMYFSSIKKLKFPYGLCAVILTVSGSVMSVTIRVTF